MLTGFFVLLIYWFVLGYFLQKILGAVFGFVSFWRTWVMGIFLGFWVTATTAGLTVILGTLNNWSLFLVFVLPVITVSLFNCSIVSDCHSERGARNLCLTNDYSFWKSYVKTVRQRFLGVNPLGMTITALFLLLDAVGFFLLASSKTGIVINSPWQTISPYFIYVFAVATFVLGLLILVSGKCHPEASQPKDLPISNWPIENKEDSSLRPVPSGTGLRLRMTNLILILLILHSFLLTSYLPLTHQLIYGADGWRHIAQEENILVGNRIWSPTLSGGQKQSGITFVAGKLSYGSLWGTSALISKVSGINLIAVNKWLQPILWSLFVPIILFEIGLSLGWTERRSLFLVWLSSLPFAMQAAGAFSLPVNFGFVSWLFALLLMFKYRNFQLSIFPPKANHSPADNFQKISNDQFSNFGNYGFLILLVSGVLMFFGYSLFAVLFWLGFALWIILKRTMFSRAFSGLLVVGIALFFPVLEWVAGYGGVRPSGFFSGLVQMVGNFTSFFLATGPRPHVIATGNVLFNQTPDYAFTPNLFTDFRWWLVIFAVAFFAMVFSGWVRSFKSGDVKFKWLGIFSAGLFLAYVISRYFLPGEHLLTRRLEPVLAVLTLVLFIKGIYRFKFLTIQRAILILGVIVISIAISASFTLGPNTGTVSADQHAAMEYVDGQIGNEIPCVISGTYPLLALQAISKDKIVGGGFPISGNFSQPDLEALNYDPKKSTIFPFYSFEPAFQATGAKSCWIVADKNSGYPEDAKIFGSTAVWKVVK